MRKSPSRSIVATGLGLSLAAALGGPSERASASTDLDPVTVTFGCTQAWSGLPRAVAESAGIAEEHQLEIECTQVASGPEQTAALLSGDIDAAQAVPGNLYPLLDQDEEMKAFMLFQDTELFDLVVHADYPLRDQAESWDDVMKDLEGATVGVPALGGAYHDLGIGLLAEAGLPEDHVNFVAVGTGPTALAALQGDQIDAALMSEPHLSLALSDGTAVQPFSLMEGTGPSLMNWASAMLISTGATVEERGDVLCRLRTVYEQAIEYIRDPENTEQVVEIMTEFMSIEPDVATTVLERNREFYPDTFDVAADRIEPAFEFFYDIGKADEAHTVDEFAVDVCAGA